MKVLMIISKKDFRDEEFNEPHEVFEANSAVVDVASTEKGDCIGKFGTQAVADRSLEQVDVEDYFAIVVVGGPGSKSLVGNKKLEEILKIANDRRIVIGAICYAPVILAKAGLLESKRSTVWNKDGQQQKIIEDAGATFVPEPVVVDGLLVTANGPEVATKFAEKVIQVADCEECW